MYIYKICHCTFSIYLVSISQFLYTIHVSVKMCASHMYELNALSLYGTLTFSSLNYHFLGIVVLLNFMTTSQSTIEQKNVRVSICLCGYSIKKKKRKHIFGMRRSRFMCLLKLSHTIESMLEILQNSVDCVCAIVTFSCKFSDWSVKRLIVHIFGHSNWILIWMFFF